MSETQLRDPCPDCNGAGGRQIECATCGGDRYVYRWADLATAVRQAHSAEAQRVHGATEGTSARGEGGMGSSGR